MQEENTFTLRSNLPWMAEVKSQKEEDEQIVLGRGKFKKSTNQVCIKEKW